MPDKLSITVQDLENKASDFLKKRGEESILSPASDYSASNARLEAAKTILPEEANSCTSEAGTVVVG